MLLLNRSYICEQKIIKHMRKVVLILLASMFTTLSLFAQKKVSGIVTDANGKPLANVSVVVKGTNIGASTNADGVFTLTVPENAKTLQFSSVSMDAKEVAVSSGNFNVKMQPKAEDLGDVIVTVPYGTVKKKAFTGAENTISSASLQKQQVTSVTKALEGLIPGLIATNGGGQPGSSSSIRIRGFGSVNASSSPLYVLNGVPYDGSIEAISSDDIESVTVLKDAAAAALYGSRAANGVILINTKKGKKGKAVVSLSARQGIMTRGIPEYDRLAPKEYYETFWEAYRNSYITQGATPADAGIAASDRLTGPNGLVYNAYNVPGGSLVDPVTGKLDPNAKLLWNESWEDALFRRAHRSNVALSISGASDNMDYFFSAGYLDEEGIVRNSGFKRYNFRLDVNSATTKWLNTGINLDGSVTKQTSVLSGGTATSNPFYYSREMGPIYPVYQHDLVTGAIVTDASGQPMLDFGTPDQMGTRPYAPRSNLRGTIELDQNYSDLLGGNLNTYAEIKFLKDFSFKTTLGLNLSDVYSTDYQNNQYGDAAPTVPGNGGRSTKSFFRQLSLTANEVLTWTKQLSLNNVKLLLGHENYKFKGNSLSADKYGFLYPGQTELDNGTASNSPASSSEDNHRIESYFANLNYDYDQKYLLSASFRSDGSSRFRDEVRWGNFYSIGLGWRITQEKFMKNVKWVNDLKLRFSYGEQGNEDIGDYYPYRAYYYATGTGSYSPPTTATNADLLWEKNKVTNLGLDFSLFKRRLSGTIELYNKVSDNLLFDVPLPASTGYSSITKNVGTMRNFGLEVQLGYNVIMKKKFNWRVDLNLTSFKNEITKLPPGQPTVSGIVTGTKKLSIYHSIYDFWLPEYAGVDASTGDALYYKDILDASGNITGKKVTNVYNQATYYYHGSAIPKISGGISNSFNYKRFDLSVLLTFAYGSLFYDGNYASLMHRGAAGTAWSTDILQRWQHPGDVTVVPRVESETAQAQEGASTRFLMDGSWLNVKNVTLSYAVPQSKKNSILGGITVFVNCDNAILFTAKKGMDPQRSFTGTSDATYTPFRTVTAGLTVNFK